MVGFVSARGGESCSGFKLWSVRFLFNTGERAPPFKTLAGVFMTLRTQHGTDTADVHQQLKQHAVTSSREFYFIKDTCTLALN